MSDTPPNAPAGLQNVRDAGGLLTAGGGRIRPGVLVRSDAPRAGDPAPAVPAWPPALVLDLRSDGEAAGPRHPLAAAGTEIRAVALSPRASIASLTTDPAALAGGLEGVYRDTIASAGLLFAELVEAVAAADGLVLVHCTAGKDRTGMLVAVLLSAIGVSREAVLADYARTDANMDGVVARIMDGGGDLAAVRRILDEHPELLATSEPAITAVLDLVESHPEGASGWLVSQGLPPKRLAELRERLVERP